MKRLVVGCLLGIAFTCPGAPASLGPASLHAAPLEATTLSHVSPLGLTPGETVILQTLGGGLNDAVSLWSNIPGAECTLDAPKPAADSKKDDPKKDNAKKEAKPDPGRARFQVKLPAGTPLGIYGVRVVTAHGSSNVRLVMVDDLPTIVELNTNKTIATAQELKPPVAVDGTCEAESYDYYKIHAEAGQRLSIEAVARRLGSGLDPVIRLLDAEGHELAYADDDESSGPDGRLSYTFKKTGDYTIELRDIRYAGGTTYRYRLRVGDFPLLGAPYPMGAQAGTKSSVQAVGSNVGKLDPLQLEVPASAAGTQLPLAAKYAAGQGSGWTTLAVATGSESAETEPNDDAATASKIASTGAINGRFDKPKDRDFYRFTAKKGDKLRFTGRTRRLGSPSDLYLKLLSADGKSTLVENDDLGLEESSIDYTVPADGEFLLCAEELLRRGGPQYVYRIEIGTSSPGFTLAVDVEKLDIPAGGVGKAKLAVARLGYTGPVKFRVDGPGGADFKVERSGPDVKNETPVLITAPAGLKPGTVLQIQIVGEADPEKGKEKTAEGVNPTKANAGPALTKLLGGLANPPAGLADRLSIFIGDAVGDPLKLSAAVKAITLAGPTAKASLPIKLEKLGKFDDVVTLTVEGLPAGVTAAPVTIAKGKAEGTIEFVGSDKAKVAAAQSIRVIAAATFMDQPKKATLADITLAIDGAAKPAAAEPAKPQAKPAAVAKTEPAKAEPAKKEPAKKDAAKETAKAEPKK